MLLQHSIKNALNNILMKNLRLWSLRLLPVLLLAVASPHEIRADIDKSFYDKAAATVWGMDLPQFNPDADLSDSIYKDKGAVYIARYRKIDALHDESTNVMKELITGYRNNNAINAVDFDRTMVKILDRSAIDNFNSVTLPIPKKNEVHGYTLMSLKPAFGARLIKPDGTVENINMDEALTVTKGKNNEDAEYKIAIPGLEPGVILDYFYYIDYFMEEQSLPAIKIDFFKPYPIKDFLVEISSPPSLALEYANYNGAPALKLDNTEGGVNHLSLHMSGIEAIEQTELFFSKARQMPYLYIYILNNTGRLGYVPKSARPGGVRTPLPAQLLQDIACAVKDGKYPKKSIDEAEGIMKQWKKNHPDASEREIIDAAYVALNFSCMKHNEKLSDRQFAKSFSRLLENMSTVLPGRVAVTSPRSAAPVDRLVHFNDATYISVVGDSCYFPYKERLYVPGEIPAGYDSEKAFRFEGAPYLDNLHSVAHPFTIPRSGTKDNITETISNLSMEPDHIEDLTITTTVNFTGSWKNILASAIPTGDIMAEWARFLGQKEPKDVAERNKENEAILQRKEMTKRAEIIWNCDNPKLISFSTPSLGCTPDKPTATLVISGLVPGMVSRAGNDLLINIGRLIGQQLEVKGSARKRDISIIQECADQQRHTIKFTVPDGYEVIPESVTSLNKTISSPVASFIVSAKVDGRDVVVQLVERHSVAVAPASAWPDILKVFDAAFEFNSAVIAIRPV